MTHTLVPVAYIRNDFTGKFGIPRQPGLCDKVLSRVELTPGYKSPDALRGLDRLSHLWLIWLFSENAGDTEPGENRLTVRPPRLGGNVRMGVFATRSPFRPNSLGLSCVEIEKVDFENVCIYVKGADLMDGTPIFDIKPYIPYSDLKPGAKEGFAPMPREEMLEVIIPGELAEKLPPEKTEALRQVLSCDPRPRYIKDGEREYGMSFAGKNIRFTVKDGILAVTGIE